MVDLIYKPYQIKEEMAELPDLTVFTNILNRKFKGEKLSSLEVTESRRLNVSEEELRSALEGRNLDEVKREGKTLPFHFSGNQVLGIHLMLRGELVDLKDGITPKFQILAFHFENGEGFALIDFQKQSTPSLNPKPVEVPDALNLKEKYFNDILSKKRTNIKTVILIFYCYLIKIAFFRGFLST